MKKQKQAHETKYASVAIASAGIIFIMQKVEPENKGTGTAIECGNR